jgi:type IV secretion system protein VirD4
MYFVARAMLRLAFLLAAYGLAVVAWLTWPYSLVAMVAIGFSILRRLRSPPRTEFGTARWATEDDLRRAKMLGAKSGMILGKIQLPRVAGSYWRAIWAVLCGKGSAEEVCRRFVEARRANGRGKPTEAVVRLPESVVNISCFSPVGGGKSAGLVIPFLLDGNGAGPKDSFCAVDYKAELALKSAMQRYRMGSDIVLLDPWKMVAGSKLRFPAATLNPLDFIDKDDPEALDHIRDLAEAMVIRTGEEKDPHWADSAEAVIATALGVII